MEAEDCPPLNINAMRAISVKSYLTHGNNSVFKAVMHQPVKADLRIPETYEAKIVKICNF